MVQSRSGCAPVSAGMTTQERAGPQGRPVSLGVQASDETASGARHAADRRDEVGSTEHSHVVIMTSALPSLPLA